MYIYVYMSICIYIYIYIYIYIGLTLTPADDHVLELYLLDVVDDELVVEQRRYFTVELGPAHSS